MPRAPNERLSRRLDAILAALRRHGIRRFKAGKLEGIGEDLEWSFEPPAKAGTLSHLHSASKREIPRVSADGDLDERAAAPEPIDELELVARGLEGPVPGNGVS